jgi:hypothetical protein
MLRPSSGRLRWATLSLIIKKDTILRRNISTLDPRKLRAQDHAQVGGRSNAQVTLPGEEHPLVIPFATRKALRFPHKTAGFFYYARGPAHAPLAGEVRFRLVDSADPSAFASGRDLIASHNGTVWSIPLLRITSPNQLEYRLLPLLQQDGLVSPSLGSLAGQHADLAKLRAPVIHSLEQPFAQNLKSGLTDVIVAHKTGFMRLSFALPWKTTLGKSRIFTYSRARVLFQFEPTQASGGLNVIGMRLLRLLERDPGNKIEKALQPWVSIGELVHQDEVRSDVWNWKLRRSGELGDVIRALWATRT